MSNPYDPNTPPNPYGSPTPSGGAGGYGDPYGQTPFGGGELPKKNDAVSIVGFVLSLTCCLSFVGMILGFVGLGRTKDGKRKGRWAAISAIIAGIIGTLALIGGIVFFVVFANSVIEVDQAEVGQCASISTEDSESVLLTEKDCSDSHEAEIVYVGTGDDVANSPFVPANPEDLTDGGISFGVCTSLMDTADVDAIGDDVEYHIVSETGNPEGDEPFFCYITPLDGGNFTSTQLP